MIAPGDIDLHLLRHAESQMNTRPDIIGGRGEETPLTELGERQAPALGAYMLRRNIIPAEVYRSPTVRTKMTARLALDAMDLHHIEPIVDEALHEMSQGDWVGLVRAEVYANPDVQRDLTRLEKNFKAPNGESMNELGVRMFAWADALSGSAHTGSPLTVFAFTHGVAIRSLAGYIHNWSRHRIFTSRTPNTSDTFFTRRNGEWQLRHLGLSHYVPVD